MLAVAITARYAKHMDGGWRKVYILTSAIALWFNLFVLVVQSFLKIPALHTLAPTQKEPPFAMAQLLVLLITVVLTITAVRRFREQPAAFTKKVAR